MRRQIGKIGILIEMLLIKEGQELTIKMYCSHYEISALSLYRLRQLLRNLKMRRVQQKDHPKKRKMEKQNTE